MENWFHLMFRMQPKAGLVCRRNQYYTKPKIKNQPKSRGWWNEEYGLRELW